MTLRSTPRLRHGASAPFLPPGPVGRRDRRYTESPLPEHAMTIALPCPIAICGIAELPAHGARGVTHVLSILDPEWPVPDAFGGFGEHARLELRFNDIIEDEPGLISPRREHVEQVLAFGRDLLADTAGAPDLLVHCHAGMSRSTASVLLLIAQALPDLPPSELAATLLAVRDRAWPNLRMVEFGDALLARRGALVAAATEIYRAQARRRPEYLQEMAGRRREVALARPA
jgi:predicted protein tyrosine phosphatase